MVFDQPTRNRLQKFVSETRTLLTDEFTRQLQKDYGMDPVSGIVSEIETLAHLDDTGLETGRLLRDTLDHYQSGSPSGSRKEALERIVREQAFTVLNRFCALRMAEARGVLFESIARGYNSDGFQLYSRLARTALGETGAAYRCYLFSIFDEFAVDLAVLFDRYSPLGRLFPRESKVLELLDKINDPEIVPLWVEDETIGWIYQYFNTDKERSQMRADSGAPRNSRELAVRNQFFTPRYVVEFLTDNTLGRMWYEMTQGKTGLKDQCHYLVRRAHEIFLSEGEGASVQTPHYDDLDQADLLKQPDYIPFRPLKDPREIRMLDPACGSMHFGLYAFDLFEKIYEEFWEIEERNGPNSAQRGDGFDSLHETFIDREDLRKNIPRLIIEHNIHGIDIDPRAVQIAGLSLWLRAQRAWKGQDLKAAKRPKILRSNIVCAESMPGEDAMLQEFADTHLKHPIFRHILEEIFEKMKLAGEAGSLLKIEDEIVSIIEEARQEWRDLPKFEQTQLFPEFDDSRTGKEFSKFAGIKDARFWNTAEEKILRALKIYSEHAQTVNASQKRLFADDAAKGFAFIDICRKSFDVVLMNPPFGSIARQAQTYCTNHYPKSYKNFGSAFVERALNLINSDGFIGSIIDYSTAVRSSYLDYRREILLNEGKLTTFCHSGWKVLDANVETCFFTLSKKNRYFEPVYCFDIASSSDRRAELDKLIEHPILSSISFFETFPNSVINFSVPSQIMKIFPVSDYLDPNYADVRTGLSTGDNERFYKLSWERPLNHDGWFFLSNGGEFSPYYRPTQEIIDWRHSGRPITEYKDDKGKLISRPQNLSYMQLPGLSYGKRGQYLSVHIHQGGKFFTNEGQGIFPINRSQDLILLSLTNSRLLRLIINEYCGQHKENGYVKILPIPASIKEKEELLAQNCIETLSLLRNCERTRIEHAESILPSLSEIDSLNTYHNNLSGELRQLRNRLLILERETNSTIEKICGLEGEGEKWLDEKAIEMPTLDKALDIFEWSLEAITSEIIDTFIGQIFGRWDIDYTLGNKDIPELADPLAPLPVWPPAMLTNPDGFPAEPKDILITYPLRISWPGILVDDEGHSEDIVGRSREVLEVIWKENAGEIEQEACDILDVDSLRTYFRKPAGFFADHLKRYSKSRRQAPIYWPISTASGNYILWLYYPRLTDQTLYSCVNDFVEPKIKQIADSANSLRQKSGRTRSEENEWENLFNFEQELKEFRDELLRIAQFWKPNLNDGVVITASPLWKLFKLPKWQETLKDTWEFLEKGEYDWAHLAYSIWPDRVREKCKTNKSIAIAHDLEALYETSPTTGTKTRKRRKERTDLQGEIII